MYRYQDNFVVHYWHYRYIGFSIIAQPYIKHCENPTDVIHREF